MALLFTLPRVSVIDLAGTVAGRSRLYFYQTGTSTPQTVYADAGLTQELTQPVRASDAGVFPAIYLDDSLQNYKVVCKDANDTDLWSVDPVLQTLTAAQVGNALYAQTASESAAGVVPVNKQYPPGHIKRYGGNGDGVADDSAAFASMIVSGAPELAIENGSFSVSGSHTLSTNGTSLVTRNASIVVRDESGAGNGVINLTASDCDVYLEFDFNSFGVGGITVAGDRNRVYAKGKDMTRTAASGSSESLIKVTGSDCTIWAEGYDLEDGGIAGAVPRVISLQGTGANNTVMLLKGRNVVDGLVSTQTDTVIDCVDLDEVTDNGLYLLSTVARVVVNGGRIRKAFEPLVIECRDVTFGALQLLDNNSSIALFDATNIRFCGTSMRHLDATLATPFIATRAGSTTCTGITLDHCQVDINIGLSGLAHFAAGGGVVNDFKVLGGCYTLTFTDESDASARIVTHTSAATSVVYKDVFIKLEDDKGTPLGGSDILNFDIPAVSADSIWDRCPIINNTGGVVRVGAVGGIIQATLYVRDDAFLRPDLGPYLQSLDSAVKREVCSSAVPTVGTWAVGDLVRNSVPALGEPEGWVCTTAGTPGTWSPFGQTGVRSGAGSPSAAVTPFKIGEVYLRTTGPELWMSTGLTNTDWLQVG
jgi:hypothetical protein